MTAKGIDLQHRSHEVRKLLHAGFSYKMAREGYDPEDVLQEVYRGLLARNQGTCQFDPEKSSFGHYVHMVIHCVLSNYHRKASRTTLLLSTYEQKAPAPEHPQEQEQEPGDYNTALQELLSVCCGASSPYVGCSSGGMPIREVLPLLAQGYSKSEIHDLLPQYTPHTIHKTIATIRQTLMMHKKRE